MKLDWLTLTKTGSQPPFEEVTSVFRALYLARAALHDIGLAASELKSVRGNPFYAYSFEDSAFPVVVSIAKDLKKQGVMLTFNGSAIALLADPIALLKKALEQGWKPTRVDVAEDVMHAPVTVAQIADLYMTAHPDSAPRLIQYIAGKTGDTFYIGSRSAPKFMRIYDKGAQQGLERDQWTRIELEYKDAAAAHLAALVVTDISKAAFEMQTMLDTMVDGITNRLMGIASSGQVIRSTAPKVKSDKVRWIRDQVVPALLSLKEDDYEGFMDAMGDLLERVMGE